MSQPRFMREAATVPSSLISVHRPQTSVWLSCPDCAAEYWVYHPPVEICWTITVLVLHMLMARILMKGGSFHSVGIFKSSKKKEGMSQFSGEMLSCKQSLHLVCSLRCLKIRSTAAEKLQDAKNVILCIIITLFSPSSIHLIRLACYLADRRAYKVLLKPPLDKPNNLVLRSVFRRAWSWLLP